MIFLMSVNLLLYHFSPAAIMLDLRGSVFETQKASYKDSSSGHLKAENAIKSFKATSGVMQELRFPCQGGHGCLVISDSPRLSSAFRLGSSQSV
jgi:hypothetical protein